jgi:MoaA/NifB/PqqE/SkfB family radical SAM enzyme
MNYAVEMGSVAMILWHGDPLAGNDREISNYTTTVTRQRPGNSSRGTMFSVQSVPRYYKQGQSAVVIIPQTSFDSKAT